LSAHFLVCERDSCANTAVSHPRTHLFLPSPPSRTAAQGNMRTGKRPREEDDDQASKRSKQSAPSGGATRAPNLDPAQILATGPARKKVINLEPFVKASLENMIKEKLKAGKKWCPYLQFAKKKKKGENDELSVTEDWLGGVPLERNCELPRGDPSKGRVGVALCTYNCGETNGDSGTLGATPFALQQEGFPANKSMRFLMFGAPVLIWDTNPMLRTRFPDWRKFTDAYAEKFGMYDLMSIALPKVTGVTMDLIKYMKKADEEKFKLWVKASADYLATYLGYCGGASNTMGIINASGMDANTNPWLRFLKELKEIAPTHEVVAFLENAVAQAMIMPHPSAIFAGNRRVGEESLMRGDKALTRIMTVLFLDEIDHIAVEVTVCWDVKKRGANAREVINEAHEKEATELRRKAAEEARKSKKEEKEPRKSKKEEAKEKRRARQAKPEAKEKRRARDAKPEARERRRARDAKPEARERKRAWNAKPEARERKRAWDAKPEARERKRARDAKPEARAKKRERKRAHRAKRKAAANAGGTGAAGEGPPEA